METNLHNYRDEPGNELGDEMAGSRVSNVLVFLIPFRPLTVWTSLSLRRGIISSLITRSLYSTAASKYLASSWSLSNGTLFFIQSRTRSALPWSDVHPYNAVRVRLEGEWEDEEDFRRCLRGEKKAIS